MHRPVVPATERDRELIADLAAERARLQVAQMMRVGGFTTADEAWLLGDSAKVLAVAVAPRRGNGEDALVDAVGAGRGRRLRIVIGNCQSIIASRARPG